MINLSDISLITQHSTTYRVQQNSKPHLFYRYSANNTTYVSKTKVFLYSYELLSSSSSSRANPLWSIDASTVCRHCSRPWARLHAVWRLMMSALRSFSLTMVCVHDCLGRLGGCLKWLSNPEITANSALEWFIHVSDLATCLKSHRRLSHRTVDGCVWLVRLSTLVLVMCWRCEMRRSLLKHHCWLTCIKHRGEWPCLASIKHSPFDSIDMPTFKTGIFLKQGRMLFLIVLMLYNPGQPKKILIKLITEQWQLTKQIISS